MVVVFLVPDPAAVPVAAAVITAVPLPIVDAAVGLDIIADDAGAEDVASRGQLVESVDAMDILATISDEEAIIPPAPDEGIPGGGRILLDGCITAVEEDDCFGAEALDDERAMDEETA